MFAEKVDHGEMSLLCMITFFIKWQSIENKYAKSHMNLIFLKKYIYTLMFSLH